MNSDSTAPMLCADLRSMDPVSYITATGLVPEDSYGFLPVEQSDGSALVYIYRDRPSYAEARAGLPAPQRSRLLGGMVEVDRPESVEIDLGGFAPGDPGAAVAEALALAESLGAQGVPQAADPAQAARPSAPIANRPEYAHGRELWATEMAKRGGWPDAEISPGSEAPPQPASSPARVEVHRAGWPRRKLIARETAENLGPRLIEEILELGYGPEHAMGLCPDYKNSKVCFAWAKD